MSNFKGFSENEIRKINTHVPSGKLKSIEDDVLNSKRVLLKVTKGQKNAVIKNLSHLKSVKTKDENSDIPDNAKLSTPIRNDEKILQHLTKEKSPELPTTFESENANDEKGNPPRITPEQDSNLKPERAKELTEPVKEISRKEKSSSDKRKTLSVSQDDKRSSNLETLQARQKLIEEQNRKRKEILAKALADKTKKTREETEKLNEIEREFKKLDALLSEDVNILRKQIEIASVDYMEAQKRYDKVEKEFLDAKFTLHQKQERKELLTEHLCTIIEKNEDRKAQKLNELLDKLNVGADEFQNKDTSPKDPDVEYLQQN